MKKFIVLLAVVIIAGIGTSFTFASAGEDDKVINTTEYETTTTTEYIDINYNPAEVAVATFQEQQKAFFEQVSVNNYLTATATKIREEAAKKAAAKKVESVQTPSKPKTSSSGGSVWDALAQCESGGNWGYPPVSGGFSGGIMFHIGTWKAYGGTAYAPDAYLASREQQIVVAEKVLAAGGWGQWPGCSAKLHLR